MGTLHNSRRCGVGRRQPDRYRKSLAEHLHIGVRIVAADESLDVDVVARQIRRGVEKIE